MNLDTAAWKEFMLSDLFEVTVSKDGSLMNTNMGKTPYIASSAANNGITGYVDAAPSQKQNTITIASNGSVGSAFYQPFGYCAAPGDIRILTPKFAFNHYIGLFVATVIRQEKFKYSYGRKLSTARIKNIIIKLPVDDAGMPDWGFMERYMRSLRCAPITTKIPARPPALLNPAAWHEFLLGDLFSLHKGKRLTREDMTDGQVNFVGAVSENNGVRQLIDIQPKYTPNCITVNYNGSVGEAFYQSSPFWASDDVNVLYAKGWTLNKYIAMFIVTVIKANRCKFGYGRKWTLDKMKKSPIKLPAAADGAPDWEYMERYIRSLPFSDRI